MRRIPLFMSIMASLAVIPSGPAGAQSAPEPDKDRDKSGQITIAPYGWAPTITGTTALGPISADVKVTPKDFLHGLKAGYMGYAQIGHRRTFIYADTIWIKQDDKAFRPFFGQPVVSSLVYVDVGAGLHRTVRLGDGRTISLSPYAGIQHLGIHTRVSGAVLQQAAKGSWTNPLIGLIAELPLSQRLGIAFKGDVSGLGLSDSHYGSGIVALQFKASRHVALVAGYRYATGEFPSPDGLALDLHGGGPLIGIRLSGKL